jgi:hypothetical protein
MPSADCYAFGQEIGRKLLQTESDISETLELYGFLLNPETAFERSVSFGMFNVLNQYSTDFAIYIADVVVFVQQSLEASDLLPPNPADLEYGMLLMQSIHKKMQNKEYPKTELDRLRELADSRNFYNILAGCSEYASTTIKVV